MKILITGASGFLGRYVAKVARTAGHEIRSFTRHFTPELASIVPEQQLGDIADYEAVARAISGCDAVIHAAARAGPWGRREQFEQANILGTDHVIRACQEHSIRYLVYTSSPSVVFEQKDIRHADETQPYSERFLAHYPATKARAEKAVLRANSPTLQTLALRPHLLWGPGDQHIAPRLLKLARRGYFILPGDGNNMIDAVYVENAAIAHINALEALIRRPQQVSGKPYFITNNQPVKTTDMIDGLLKGYGARPINYLHIPKSAARYLGAAFEHIYTICGLPGEPPLTRFTATQLSCDHYFDGKAAEVELGYRPQYTMSQGFDILRHFHAQWIYPN